MCRNLSDQTWFTRAFTRTVLFTCFPAIGTTCMFYRTWQMNATEQYFLVVLFITLYEVVLSFDSVDEILKCDHSKGSYSAVLSCGAVYYAVQGGSNF